MHALSCMVPCAVTTSQRTAQPIIKFTLACGWVSIGVDGCAMLCMFVPHACLNGK